MSQLQEQISLLFKQKAISFSDIHIETGQIVHVRVPRGLVPVEDSPVVGKEEMLAYLNLFAPENKRAVQDWQDLIDIGEGQHVDRFETEDAAMRAALFNTGGGRGDSRSWALALRVMPTAIPEFVDLGLPVQLLKQCDRPSGLIVFTGPTGSGKSTSMAACIRHINKTQNARIITLEDPIEYKHQNIRSMVSQRERPHDFTSFEKGVVQAMREDPDVIVVGEVNDLASLRGAVSAALTGHLVITSMHTTSAPDTISRMIDMYPAEEKAMIRSIISDLLLGVVSQKILPSIDGKKRVLAHEIMTVDSGIRTLMKEGKIQNITNEMNMVRPTQHTLNTSLAQLVRDEKISVEVALGASYDADNLVKVWDVEMSEEG